MTIGDLRTRKPNYSQEQVRDRLENCKQLKAKEMSKVITFSRRFPATHPRNGEATLFVPAINKSLTRKHFLSTGNILDALFALNKHLHKNIVAEFEYENRLLIPQWLDLKPKKHTIRGGHRWESGDKFSPRVWSGRPYCSPQITIAPDIEIKRVVNICSDGVLWFVKNKPIDASRLAIIAANDGLSIEDFKDWFKNKPFSGQIIIWDAELFYL